MSTTTRKRRLSDAERDARRARDRELMHQSVAALLTSEGWQNWLAVRRHFHTYSFANQILIASQRPEATRVAGFKAWLKLGYCVRKGETGIRIWAPVPPSKKQLRDWKHAGANPATRPRTFFRLAAVFDCSQVEPLPGFPGDPAVLDMPIEPIDGDSLQHLFPKLVRLGVQIGSSVKVQKIPGPTHGYYEPKTRKIVIDGAPDDLRTNAQVATLIHELSHALVRADRHDDDPTLSYAEEEIVVETVAYCVCATVGLDTSGNSVPYVVSWADGADGPEAIHRYATLIDRLARRLESAVAGDEGRMTTRCIRAYRQRRPLFSRGAREQPLLSRHAGHRDPYRAIHSDTDAAESRRTAP